MESNEYLNGAKKRLSTIRLRAWTLTLAIVISLVFYLIVNVTTKSSINIIDFVLLCFMQIIAHSIYFPEGELFGKKDSAFIANKDAYNQKATKINQDKKIARLREYCKIEFEERKRRYFLNELGKLEITEDEFEGLKAKNKKDIKKMKYIEIEEKDNKSRIVFLSKHKRKILYNLLFGESPIEENHPETIMSAVINDGTHSIKDNSIAYKTRSFISKILTAIIVGGIFAYIGYAVKDGFGWEEVVSISMYLTTLLTTSVMAFSSGETCTKVHKSHFYIDLSNFIDSFNEWDAKYKEG